MGIHGVDAIFGNTEAIGRALRYNPIYVSEEISHKIFFLCISSFLEMHHACNTSTCERPAYLQKFLAMTKTP